MTKSTLNSLWVMAGVIALWLGVNPGRPTTPASQPVESAGASPARVSSVDDLLLQEAKLQHHSSTVALRQSTRNPFRFGKTRAAGAPRPAAAAPVAAPPPSAQPAFVLAGIASDGGLRTAIISGDGQLYLVKPGEMVADRYRVVKVESDSVTLQDAGGSQLRLMLPPQ